MNGLVGGWWKEEWASGLMGGEREEGMRRGERKRGREGDFCAMTWSSWGELPRITDITSRITLCGPQAACDVFCVGDDVNIEKANNSLISNDRSWKRNKFRLTYVAEAPELTQGT